MSTLTDRYTDRRIITITIDDEYPIQSLGNFLKIIDIHYFHRLYFFLFQDINGYSLSPSTNFLELFNVPENVHDGIFTNEPPMEELFTYLNNSGYKPSVEESRFFDSLRALNGPEFRFSPMGSMTFTFRSMFPNYLKLEIVKIEKVNPLQISLSGLGDILKEIREFIIYVLEIKSNLKKRRQESYLRELEILERKLRIKREYGVSIKTIDDFIENEYKLENYVVSNWNRNKVKIDIYDAEGNVI